MNSNLMYPIRSESICAGYENNLVLDKLCIRIPNGKITAIIGPNGSGKSTLLRCLANLHPCDAGHIYLHDRNINEFSNKELAQQLAFVPQNASCPPGLSVEEVVALGRHPHRHWFQTDSSGPQKITQSLADTQLEKLKHQYVEHLSGGQCQRVWIALALAQGAHTLLLDEPTNHLDPVHRTEVMAILKNLTHIQKCTVVVVLHDLVLAANTCDHIILLDDGQLLCEGTPNEVFTNNHLSKAYDINFDVLTNERNNKPIPIQFF